MHSFPTGTQILHVLLMGINNTYNSAVFCALLTEDPVLWHEREGMSFVCLAGVYLFALQ